MPGQTDFYEQILQRGAASLPGDRSLLPMAQNRVAALFEMPLKVTVPHPKVAEISFAPAA